MPLAKYVTDFEAMDRKAQAIAVIKGQYTKPQLESLKKYTDSPTVLETIDTMLGHGELELDTCKYHGPKFQDKTIAGNEYRFDHLQMRIKVRSGQQAWKLYFKHDDLAVLESAWFTIDNNAIDVLEKSKLEPGSNLIELAAQINEEYASFEEIEKQATMSMLKLGLMLEHAKEQLPHGQLMKWANANLTMTYRHAANFRKLAQVFIKAQQIDSAGMMALIDPANSQEALGERLRQMAF
jgi:hypothetical protein